MSCAVAGCSSSEPAAPAPLSGPSLTVTGTGNVSAGFMYIKDVTGSLEVSTGPVNQHTLKLNVTEKIANNATGPRSLRMVINAPDPGFQSGRDYASFISYSDANGNWVGGNARPQVVSVEGKTYRVKLDGAKANPDGRGGSQGTVSLSGELAFTAP
jgi:hypothetical protein